MTNTNFFKHNIEPEQVFSESRKFLERRNIPFQIQSFISPFGLGHNLIITQEYRQSSEFVIFTAHYDGPNFYDNLGGVLALLSLVDLFYRGSHRTNLVFALLDQEESFQFGAKAFIKKLFSFAGDSVLKNKYLFNIDGIGIGDQLIITNTSELRRRLSRSFHFRTDLDVFDQYLSSRHVFSLPPYFFSKFVHQKLCKCDLAKLTDEDFCQVHFRVTNVVIASRKLFEFYSNKASFLEETSKPINIV